MSPVLEVHGLHSRYGVTPILRGIDFTVGKGEIVALIGRNGVGKTTTMRCLIGLLPATAGKIVFNGHDITGLPADRRARLGVGYIPQGRHVFPRMTVEENLMIGELIGNAGKSAIDDVYQYFPVLKEKRRQVAGALSGGQQQQLAIGRALVGKPELLLLDEPSEGIQPSIVQLICEVLRTIRDAHGTTILFVEQSMDTILALAERCYIVEKGLTIASIAHGNVCAETVRRYLLI